MSIFEDLYIYRHYLLRVLFSLLWKICLQFWPFPCCFIEFYIKGGFPCAIVMIYINPVYIWIVQSVMCCVALQIKRFDCLAFDVNASVLDAIDMTKFGMCALHCIGLRSSYVA